MPLGQIAQTQKTRCVISVLPIRVIGMTRHVQTEYDWSPRTDTTHISFKPNTLAQTVLRRSRAQINHLQEPWITITKKKQTRS